MTTARLSKRRTHLERNAHRVLDDFQDGLGPTAIARKYKVSPEAVQKFKERHQDEITANALQLRREASDYKIAQKVYRIGELEDLYNESRAIGREAETPQDKLAAVRVASDRLKQAAEELGQLPKQDITLNVQNNVLNLNWDNQEPQNIVESSP